MIGIVILNYNSFELTLACIKSIQEENLRYHVYVVDNGSSSENYECLKSDLSCFQSLTLIKNSHNLGFAAGMNVGIKQAVKDDCNYVVISNSDIIFHQNSITQLFLKMQSDETIGIIGPRIIDPEGKEQHFNVWKRESLFQYLLMETAISVCLPKSYKYKFLMKPETIYDCDRIAYSLSGCIFMMRTEDIKEINYLDEYTFLYSEEFILAEQMRKISKRVLYNGNVCMTHNHQGSTNQGNVFVEKQRIRSRMYYLKEYRNAPYIYRLIIYLMMLVVPMFFKKVISKKRQFYRETIKLVR